MIVLLAWLTSAQPGLPLPQPPSGEREVAIQAHVLELPLLPSSLAEGHAAYPKMQAQLAITSREVEQDLIELYASLRTEGPSGAIPCGPLDDSEESRTLALCLQDDVHLALEEAAFDEWIQWQTQLLQQGLALTKGGSAITSRMVLLAFQRHELRPRQQGQSYPLFDLVAVNGLDYQSRAPGIPEAAALANLRAPRLAQAWSPLARHFNTRALSLLDLERAAPNPQDPALRLLRLQAKINVLERFRASLWFCQMVWAHVASSPLPPPLKGLRN